MIRQIPVSQSDKNCGLALRLAAGLGLFGAHHFYLGRPVEGLLDLGLFALSAHLCLSGQWLPGLAFLVLNAFHTLLSTAQLLTGSYRDRHGAVVSAPLHAD